LIDSHVHLDADQYPDPSGAIKRARAAGVSAMVVPGTGPDSNGRVLELAEKFPETVHAALGLHPERFEHTERDVDETLALIERRRDSICAVGEVGLPWYGEHAHDVAIVASAAGTLARFAALAARIELPLILHAPHQRARQALAILREAGATRAVFHWHKSDDATTRAIVDAGYFVSLTLEVAYRERDQELARWLPLDRMLVETDGPWPYGGQFAGHLTEPAMIKDAVAAIAHIRCATSDEIASATTANARALFKIRDSE
jgi:TatD DNase family protein